MKKYIAILRGINVSGQKLMKMAELKTYLKDLNFNNVSTYIQSGNISFESGSSNQKEMEAQIGNKIKEKYDFEVPIIVKSAEEMKRIAENNPFLNHRQEDSSKLYVTFLADEPDIELVNKFRTINYAPDEFIVVEKVLYGFVPVSYGNTKFSNNFIESKLKTTATTRNWKTVLKLLEMVGD